MDFTEYEQAIGYFAQALSADPNQKDVRANQGFAYFMLGEELGMKKIIGIAVVLAGLFISQLRSRNKAYDHLHSP